MWRFEEAWSTNSSSGETWFSGIGLHLQHAALLLQVTGGLGMLVVLKA